MRIPMSGSYSYIGDIDNSTSLICCLFGLWTLLLHKSPNSEKFPWTFLVGPTILTIPSISISSYTCIWTFTILQYVSVKSCACPDCMRYKPKLETETLQQWFYLLSRPFGRLPSFNLEQNQTSLYKIPWHISEHGDTHGGISQAQPPLIQIPHWNILDYLLAMPLCT